MCFQVSLLHMKLWGSWFHVWCLELVSSEGPEHPKWCGLRVASSNKAIRWMKMTIQTRTMVNKRNWWRSQLMKVFYDNKVICFVDIKQSTSPKFLYFTWLFPFLLRSFVPNSIHLDHLQPIKKLLVTVILWHNLTLAVVIEHNNNLVL